jgi:hypothetical protein
MAFDRAVTARGAVAGAVAAGVWAFQQPLDKRVFGVDYDDGDLLGTAVTSGRAERPVVYSLHIGNGAMFGALYANVEPRLPLPSWTRGPLLAMAECVATWPATAALPKVHPAGDGLPQLWGSTRAFAQATWRHLLFGVVLGELERRLNAPEDEEVPEYEHVVSSNGHGNIEHAVVGITPQD